MNRVVEPLGEGLSRVWEISEVLAESRTPYQHVVIARTAQGVTLFCDSDRQSSEASQLVYHEALLVPALLLAARLDRVLVIGSSEGVVSQLAVAAGAGRVDHVDIDRAAVELCARHLPYGYSPAELRRAERHDGPIHLHYADGLSFVAETSNPYDIVVIDLPDEHPGAAQHNRLYEADFLAWCASLLTPGGVVATQAGCPTLWRNRTLADAWDRFHKIFGGVTYYGSDEQEWAFLFGQTEPGQLKRIKDLVYRPASLDAEALTRGTIAPYSVRCRPRGEATG